MPLGRQVGLGPGDFVLDGYPAPPPQKWQSSPTNFRRMCIVPNGWMDQDATWLEVGLGPGHVVLDGDPAPSLQKGAQPPILLSVHVCCGQAVAHLCYC